MPKISVIVPVYNVEKYLHECVDSILAQTFKDFELILVDDGSPDNCGMICDEYAQKDTRVRVIHQENQGLSGARNSGIDVAQGECITFVDSDDLTDAKYLEVLMDAMEEGTDITVCGFQIFEDGTKPYCRKSSTEKTCYEVKLAVTELYNGNSDIPVNACGKLFRRDVIGEIRFPVGRLHEDQAFTPLVCYRARKVVSCLSELYYYRERTASITRKTFSEKRYDDLWAIDSCIAFFKSKNEQQIVEAALRRRQRLICTYAIYAKRDGVEVPEPYRISIWEALWYLRKNVSAEKYQYCLAQLYPKLVVLDAYARKISSVLRIKK